MIRSHEGLEDYRVAFEGAMGILGTAVDTNALAFTVRTPQRVWRERHKKCLTNATRNFRFWLAL